MPDPLRDAVPQRNIVLARQDFGGAAGVNLVAYRCRRCWLSELQKWKTGQQSWILGAGDPLAVVFAEPLFDRR